MVRSSDRFYNHLMKACILSGALLMSMTYGQMDVEFGHPANLRPENGGFPHPNPSEMREHPLIGAPDGHDGHMGQAPPPHPMSFGKPCMKGRHHNGRRGHKGHREHPERPEAQPTGVDPNGNHPQNMDFRIEVQGN